VANPFRKNNGWPQYGLVFVISIMIMVMDATTSWLSGPRNVLSVAVSPVQYLASIPSSIGRYFTNTISAEPDVQLSYDNLRNEYFKLKSETLLLRTLEDENRKLRALLAASERLNEEITLAELIDVNLDRNNHRISVACATKFTLVRLRLMIKV